MNVLTVTVTEAGRSLARRLPFPAAHGQAGDTVRAHWGEVDAFVLVLAVGAATRIVGPLLADKRSDPTVVCVDDAGRWVVPIAGGHAGGGNDLAGQIAELIGATAVVTTASDVNDVSALDTLPGFVTRGDVAGVTRALLDGDEVRVLSELPGWPAPLAGRGAETSRLSVIVTDRAGIGVPGQVRLHPPSLVVGIGCSTGAPPDRVRALVHQTLEAAGLMWESVAAVATIDRRAEEPALLALDRPVVTFGADDLAAVDVPTPSPVVAAAVGTPSVAEAAALLAAGPDGELVVAKQKNGVATIAVVRRSARPGEVVLVGLGPGDAAHRTPAADTGVRHADVVVGYEPYVDQAASLLSPNQQVLRMPIGAEVERAQVALAEAAGGRRVALVCSGDAGIYAMASIVDELAPSVAPGVDITVVPGVTAALAAAAVLGAPLGHDHAVVSLSDLLTPWDVIERRVQAAAEGDFVTIFYNPRSRGRDWQLAAALDILRRRRRPTTPVGVVSDAGRRQQRASITTLADFDPSIVGMTTCVIVGSSTTVVTGGRMVTPRGYKR